MGESHWLSSVANSLSGWGRADYIGAAGVIIAGLTFIYTWWNIRDQNLKWATLHGPRVELVEMSFKVTEILRSQTAHTEWVAEPESWKIKDGTKPDPVLQFNYEMVWADKETRKRVPQSNGFLSVSEANAELRRLGVNPESVYIRKYYSVSFGVKNFGQTPALELRSTISMKDPRFSGEIELYRSNEGRDLLPGFVGFVFGPHDFSVSLDSNEPEATEFRIKLAYKNHKSETVNQVLPCKYLWKSDRWLLAQ